MSNLELSKNQQDRETEQGQWSEERLQVDFEKQKLTQHISSLQEELATAEQEIERVTSQCI